MAVAVMRGGIENEAVRLQGVIWNEYDWGDP